MELRFNRDKIRDNVLGALATGLFTGFSPVLPGTAASLAAAALWWLAAPRSHWLQILFVILAFAAGWAAARAAQGWWGEDDRRIVAGDFAGMWLALATYPRNPALWAVGLVLFRLIDAVKFYPALHCRGLGRGWGLMAEKAVAGAYAGLLLTAASPIFVRFPSQDLILGRLALYGTSVAAATASVVYGSHRGGLAVLAVASGSLLFLEAAPRGPWRQAAALLAAAAALASGLRLLAGRPWAVELARYVILAWGCWLAMWFLPKTPAVAMAGALLTALFRHVRPYPTNYLPHQGPTASMFAPNIIAGLYAGAVLQVGLMFFGRADMGFIRYAVTGILRLFNIRG